MSDDWIGRGVVFFISIALFVATEVFFPLDQDSTSTAVKQKHFWATMLFIFSVILGLPIETSSRLEKHVSSIKTELHEHEEQAAMHDKFHETYDQYAGIFSGPASQDHPSARQLMRDWGDTLIDYLNVEFRSREIPIPLEQAPNKIKDVYGAATDSIVATNVGGTKTYFDNVEYVQANRHAMAHHVPVIRFYLYDDERRKHILLRSGRAPISIDEFFSEVKELHALMGSTYSAVIDVERARDLDGYRDLLLMDNAFLAETKILPTTWDPVRAEATVDQTKIHEAREYFRKLRLGVLQSGKVVKMTDADVRKNYPAFRTADTVFVAVMDRLCGPM